MISRSVVATWLRPLASLADNPITFLGTVLTTSSAVTMLGFWFVELLLDRAVHPYAGIILFLVLPGVFLFGLLLIPIGALLRRRRRAAEALRPVDLGAPFARRALTWIALATGLNVVLLSTAAYRGVVYMDSTQFCGLTCHSVMAPQYSAYLGSSHSRVACTECHIGAGASWFVRSKLSGTRQLFAVAFGTYSRPIPSPVRNLRPSRETCEHCHWPQRFVGDKLIVRTRYDNDEANTPLTTVLVMKIGGGNPAAPGIHGHHLASRITYVSTDGRRQVVPRVSVMRPEGETEFVSTELKPTADELARGERRTMDCIDCHNRPTHAFELPERAVDQAIADGGISRELPFVKKKSVELLRAEYPDRAAAVPRIRTGLAEYYRLTYPAVYNQHRSQVEAAAARLEAIYLRNIFPELRVAWGTYPNNIGHENFPGCFRCHDDSHRSADGHTITQDCNACHSVLAQDERSPKILADLDMTGAPQAH